MQDGSRKRGAQPYMASSEADAAVQQHYRQDGEPAQQVYRFVPGRCRRLAALLLYKHAFIQTCRKRPSIADALSRSRRRGQEVEILLQSFGTCWFSKAP